MWRDERREAGGFYGVYGEFGLGASGEGVGDGVLECGNRGVKGWACGKGRWFVYGKAVANDVRTKRGGAPWNLLMDEVFRIGLQ